MENTPNPPHMLDEQIVGQGPPDTSVVEVPLKEVVRKAAKDLMSVLSCFHESYQALGLRYHQIPIEARVSTLLKDGERADGEEAFCYNEPEITELISNLTRVFGRLRKADNGEILQASVSLANEAIPTIDQQIADLEKVVVKHEDVHLALKYRDEMPQELDLQEQRNLLREWVARLPFVDSAVKHGDLPDEITTVTVWLNTKGIVSPLGEQVERKQDPYPGYITDNWMYARPGLAAHLEGHTLKNSTRDPIIEWKGMTPKEQKQCFEEDFKDMFDKLSAGKGKEKV